MVAANTVGKRGKGKVIGGLLAVVALIGAGGFAVSKIVAGSDGGAANPTDVGTHLMSSLAAEDVLGVVDLLLPGERDMMRQPLIDMVDNLKRLGVADSTANLQKVGALDISFENVEVKPTPTNVDDVSDIRITAKGTVAVDGKKVPIGPLLIDEAFGGTRPHVNSQTQSSDLDWHLATVKHGGRWYLSAFYSIAENARKGVGDVPETPIVAHGADTPEGAVQAIFNAVDDLDLQALIATLNPNEAEALQRYAPLFIDKAQSSVDKLKVNIGFSDTKFTVAGSGDRRTVSIDGFKMHFSKGSQDVTVELKGGCTVMTVGDTTTDSCASGNSIDSMVKALGLDDNNDVQSLIKTVRDAFKDMKPVGVTVQNVGGKWFVSPVGTGADAILAVMAALDKGELTDIIDGIKKVSQTLSVNGGLFGATSGTDTTDTSGTDPASTDPTSTDPSVTYPSVTYPSSTETSVPDTSVPDTSGASGMDRCYQHVDYVAFSACITAGINDGSIDATFVPAYFRFADCGVGEKYFNGGVYSMSDADFMAFATAAAPCFKKYVDNGTISVYGLPYELSRPDCLEGKNWYAATDSAYFERLGSCVSG